MILADKFKLDLILLGMLKKDILIYSIEGKNINILQYCNLREFLREVFGEFILTGLFIV